MGTSIELYLVIEYPTWTRH